MCGIFGIVSNKQDLRRFSHQADKALFSLRHRGPDDINNILTSSAIIGHTRLSIIDLEHGKQPMKSQDGNLIIAFNGEIYNYKALRNDLQLKGYRFLTQSDTEVALASFQYYGIECLQLFRGMFSFVIYNIKTGELFAARDRYGIKPFYYSLLNDLFVFSSEIKAIYSSGLISFEPRAEHFNEYLIFGYIAGEETLHKRIKELKPAHYLVFKDGDVKTERYWYPFRSSPSDPSLCDEDKIIDTLEEKVKEAVSLWTVSDVEVTSLLSGGIDSSLVTKLASDTMPDIKTITAYFSDDRAIDERIFSNIIADKISVKSCLVSIKDTYIIDNLYRLSRHFGEPIHDSNYFTLMAICEGIRNQSSIKVLLCGEGADELFGGYARHRIIADRYNQNKDLEALCYAMNYVAIPRLKMFTDDVSISNNYRYSLSQNLIAKDAVNMTLELDQQTFLTSYLHRQDRVGMLFGLEIRTPYLEHVLAEYVNDLPSGFKIKDKWHKWILRKVCERHLPSEIAWRKTKTAFSWPVSRMLHNGTLRTIFRELINPRSCIASHYSIDGIYRLLESHNPAEERCDHGNTLWRILSLELWLKSYA